MRKDAHCLWPSRLSAMCWSDLAAWVSIIRIHYLTPNTTFMTRIENHVIFLIEYIKRHFDVFRFLIFI